MDINEEEEDEDDDIIFLTPLEACITHKPNETKYDTLTGFIPFQTAVSQTQISR